MTDQATRDADRELDLALDAELREDVRAKARKSFIESLTRTEPSLSDAEIQTAIDKYDEEHRTWQGDRFASDEHRQAMDTHFELLQAGLDSAEQKAAAEERAKKRMEARQAFTARLKQRVRAFMMAVWSLVFLGMVGAGVWGYYNFKTIVPAWDKYTSAQKNCIFKVGERTVTGTRTVSYRYYQILDWRAHDESTVETETRLDINGNGMTVIQYIDGKAEKLAVSDGEKYRPLLKPAERYSFFMDNGKNFAELSFNDICK